MPDPDRKTNAEQGEQYSYHGNHTAPRHFQRRQAKAQAEFLMPHLGTGMTLLDCGCGPGAITVGLAKLVAPGQVIGIDIDDAQIAQARALAQSQNTSNVGFEAGDVYNLRFADNTFDAVFSHGVLHHLADPVTALREMYRVLKPGGVLGVRDPDMSGKLLYPDDPLLLRFEELWRKLIAMNGGNPQLGRTLKALLRETAFVDIRVSANYESYGSSEAVGYWSDLLITAMGEERYRKALSALGIASGTLDDMQRAWKAWARDPDAFFADAWCEAVGWKPL